MLFVNLFFSILNPYRLAFTEWDNPAWIALDLAWDLFFLVDLILTFFKAYYDEYFLLKDRRTDISKRYLSGWFFIDLIGILPIYYVTGTKDY
jgi:hypothetical protein